MAYSLADPRPIVSDDSKRPVQDSTIEDWDSSNLSGSTSTYKKTMGGSTVLQFEDAIMRKIRLNVRATSANSPGGTGVPEAPATRVPVAAIVGASVAGAVVLLVAGLCVYFLWWRQRKPHSQANNVKDEEVVYFPDTHPLIDHTDPVTFPRDSESDAHPLTFSPDPSDPDAHLLAYPDTPPLLGSARRGYFPSAPASERSTSFAPSASLSLSMSALGASSSLPRGDAGTGIGPLAVLEEAARGRMASGVQGEALRGGMGAGDGIGDVADEDTVHVADSPSVVHAGYEVHSAVHQHSMHASVGLARSSAPSTSAGSAVSRAM
ncbi:hypothetical protein C8T65DRAFT_745555 [Cerioporus squamosus]|nr:hypothetical protein C8T65DRAFT_745555 [Cerioporus squamosus]